MNESVKKWQQQLAMMDLYQSAIDGDFGPKTLAASMEVLDADDVSETVLKKIAEAPPAAETYKGGFIYRKPSRAVSELIWHCAATPEGRNFTVADIDSWHRQRGWSGIGYHFVVYRDGTIHKGRDINRTGAHVGGRNTGTIGATYIGGVTSDSKRAKDTRTPEQEAAMLWLTKEIARDNRIKVISGHNQYAAKACPSFDVRTDELGNISGFTKGKRN